MKKILFIIGLCLLSLGGSAKPSPATSMWYVMFLSDDTKCSDDNIEIVYNGRSGFSTPALRGLIPKMTIMIKNKTDKTIYIDLSNCICKKNDCVTPFSHKQRIVQIPAHSRLEEEIVLFQHGDEKQLGNLIYFTDKHIAMSGSARFDYIFAPQRDDLMVGEVLRFDEGNSILDVTNTITYSFDLDFKELKTLISKYYTKYLFGTKYILNPCSTKERDIVVSTWTKYNLPESPNSFEIRLWAPKR